MTFKAFSFLLAAVALLGGCSTDFDVTSDWQDIAVVYCVLNHADTAHYVKVTKAYLDPETNALQQSQVEDSLYYGNLHVRLEGYNDGTLAHAYDLEKIDGNLDGHPKEPGTFVTSPNWLYKTKGTLNPTYTYKLVITKNDNDVVTAETNLIDNVIVVKPTPLLGLNIVPNQTYTTTWKNAKNASFYGLTCRFWYLEYPATNPADSVLKSFSWQILDNYVPDIGSVGAAVEYKFDGPQFYNALVQNIPVNTDLIRKAKHADFIFAAGGRELYTYYLVNVAQSGLLSGQIVPQYSNIANGRGILSSRYFNNIAQIPLKAPMIDSIACSALTKDRKFINSQGDLCP